MKTVPERLAALGELYRNRNAQYQNNYLEFGAIMMAMFPRGLNLQTIEEFNRFTNFVQAFAKFVRYSKAIKSGGHADSLDDISVACQMMQEFDEISKQKPNPVHVDWGYKSQPELETGANELRGG